MPERYGIEGKKEARGWRAYYPYTTGEFIRDYLQKKGESLHPRDLDGFPGRSQGTWFGMVGEVQ